MPEVARRTRRAAVLLIPLLLMLFFGARGAQRWVDDMLQPVNPGTAEPVAVRIPAGVSSRDIGEILFAQGLIKDPVVFRYYARYKQMDAGLKPGQYQLSGSMSLDEILEKLTRGEVVTYRFTIREGLTLEETADRLAELGLADRDRFMELATASGLANQYLPEGVELEHPLEGYLFPATYIYTEKLTEEEIIDLMFGRFQQVWTAELKGRAQELGLSVHQVVTLASIIEKEAQVASERARIAGVYHNRLAIGMKLDADPTVRYALKKPPGEIVYYRDLEVESPYNTYRTNGLPPGPIAAPGEASIKAALWPEQHDLWYFVAKEDGSGEHYFAETLEEQTRNIEKARANEKR